MKTTPTVAIALAMALTLSAKVAAANDPLVRWFASETCRALDGLYSTKQPPYVKTGFESLVVDVPTDVAAHQEISMTTPWYVYDAQAAPRSATSAAIPASFGRFAS